MALCYTASQGQWQDGSPDTCPPSTTALWWLRESRVPPSLPLSQNVWLLHPSPIWGYGKFIQNIQDPSPSSSSVHLENHCTLTKRKSESISRGPQARDTFVESNSHPHTCGGLRGLCQAQTKHSTWMPCSLGRGHRNQALGPPGFPHEDSLLSYLSVPGLQGWGRGREGPKAISCAELSSVCKMVF